MKPGGARMSDQWWTITKWSIDGVSIMAIIGTIVGILPALAALGGLIWYAIQIYESDTFQKWIDKRRTEHKIKAITRLVAKHKMLVAELDALGVVREARAVAADKVAAATQEARRQLSIDTTAKAVKIASEEVVKSTPEG